VKFKVSSDAGQLKVYIDHLIGIKVKLIFTKLDKSGKNEIYILSLIKNFYVHFIYHLLGFS